MTDKAPKRSIAQVDTATLVRAYDFMLMERLAANKDIFNAFREAGYLTEVVRTDSRQFEPGWPSTTPFVLEGTVRYFEVAADYDDPDFRRAFIGAATNRGRASFSDDQANYILDNLRIESIAPRVLGSGGALDVEKFDLAYRRGDSNILDIAATGLVPVNGGDLWRAANAGFGGYNSYYDLSFYHWLRDLSVEAFSGGSGGSFLRSNIYSLGGRSTPIVAALSHDFPTVFLSEGISINPVGVTPSLGLGDLFDGGPLFGGEPDFLPLTDARAYIDFEFDVLGNISPSFVRGLGETYANQSFGMDDAGAVPSGALHLGHNIMQGYEGEFLYRALFSADPAAASILSVLDTGGLEQGFTYNYLLAAIMKRSPDLQSLSVVNGTVTVDGVVRQGVIGGVPNLSVTKQANGTYYLSTSIGGEEFVIAGRMSLLGEPLTFAPDKGVDPLKHLLVDLKDRCATLTSITSGQSDSYSALTATFSVQGDNYRIRRASVIVESNESAKIGAASSGRTIEWTPPAPMEQLPPIEFVELEELDSSGATISKEGIARQGDVSISFGQLGSQFGSSLSRLIQTDDPWVSLGVGTLLGTIGLNIGQAIDAHNAISSGQVDFSGRPVDGEGNPIRGDVTPVSHPAGTGVRSSSNAPNGRPSSSSFLAQRAA